MTCYHKNTSCSCGALTRDTIKLGEYYIKNSSYRLRDGVYSRVSNDNKNWEIVPVKLIIDYCQINELDVPKGVLTWYR